MKKKRYPEAFNSFQRLRRHPIIAARDMYYSHILFMEEQAMSKGTTYWSRNWDCLAVPRLRRGSWAAWTVMIAQQMCGINSEYRPCQFTAQKQWLIRVLQSFRFTVVPCSLKPVPVKIRPCLQVLDSEVSSVPFAIRHDIPTDLMSVVLQPCNSSFVFPPCSSLTHLDVVRFFSLLSPG